MSFEELLSLWLSDTFALVVGCINNNWLNMRYTTFVESMWTNWVFSAICWDCMSTKTFWATFISRINVEIFGATNTEKSYQSPVVRNSTSTADSTGCSPQTRDWLKLTDNTFWPYLAVLHICIVLQNVPPSSGGVCTYHLILLQTYSYVKISADSAHKLLIRVWHQCFVLFCAHLNNKSWGLFQYSPTSGP